MLLGVSGNPEYNPVASTCSRFYFPTYENDNLLHMLPTDDNNAVSEALNDDVTENSHSVKSDDSFTTYILPEDIEVDEESMKRMLDLKTMNIIDDNV